MTDPTLKVIVMAALQAKLGDLICSTWEHPGGKVTCSRNVNGSICNCEDVWDVVQAALTAAGYDIVKQALPNTFKCAACGCVHPIKALGLVCPNLPRHGWSAI